MRSVSDQLLSQARESWMSASRIFAEFSYRFSLTGMSEVQTVLGTSADNSIIENN